jgi:hypothetical protein
LVESILEPNVYLAPDYAANIMPGTYGALPPQDLADIVAYLLTLR